MPKIYLCDKHKERPTPLICTFAFHGAEFWCPWCGSTEGMFNGCERLDPTPVLEAVAAEDLARSKEYLSAVSALSCDRLEWEGKWVAPADLPPAAIEKFEQTRKAWRYPASAETITSRRAVWTA